MDERRSRIERLVIEALNLAPAERSAFVRAACAEDASLLAEVGALLDACASAATFLEAPVLATAVTRHAMAAPAIPAAPAAAPAAADRRIGRYRVLATLGVGGMGVVYLAEQDHPRRTVALKVIRPELATERILRRFEMEGEILARLKHPGIAQVYEAGTADTGQGPQPYLAMELVNGRPIDVHAAGKLGARDRMELIARVCDAVQHAHQQGVVHRDLKPGNILVDASGQPKVLDFGVARFSGSEQGEGAKHTLTGQIVGTLPYMSPEQASGSPAAIDTRTDVYALGAILYLLLSGRTPHRLDDANVLEAARMIRDDEPPSLGTIDRSLRGDAETIVAKALEKDKERRYQSPAELAADIRRFLADEPIMARPASTFYLLRKFAARNRALVGGIATTVVVLVLGLATTAFFALESRRHAVEEREAKQGLAASFDAVRRHLMSQEVPYATSSRLLERLRPDERPDIKGGTLLVLELVDQRSGVMGKHTDLVLLGDDGATYRPPTKTDAAFFPPAERARAAESFTSDGGLLMERHPELPHSERELVVLQKGQSPGLGALSIFDLGFHLKQRMWSSGYLADVTWDARDGLLIVTGMSLELPMFVPELAPFDSAGCPTVRKECFLAAAVRPENLSGQLFPSENPAIACTRSEWAFAVCPPERAAKPGEWQAYLHAISQPRTDDRGVAGVVRFRLDKRLDELHPGSMTGVASVWMSAPISSDGRFLEPPRPDEPLGPDGPPAGVCRVVSLNLPEILQGRRAATPLFLQGLSAEQIGDRLDADTTLTPAVRISGRRAGVAMWSNWRWLNNRAGAISEHPPASEADYAKALAWAQEAVRLHTLRCPDPQHCKPGWYPTNTLAMCQVRAGKYADALKTLEECAVIWRNVYPATHGNAVDIGIQAMALNGLGRHDEARAALERSRAILAEGPMPDDLDAAAHEVVREASALIDRK
jgi:hypothetical protein